MGFDQGLVLGWALFGLGLLGLVIRRSFLSLLFCLTLMLNGVLLAWSSVWPLLSAGDEVFTGSFAWLLLVVLAVQFLVGLQIINSTLNRTLSLDVERHRSLKS